MFTKGTDTLDHVLTALRNSGVGPEANSIFKATFAGITAETNEEKHVITFRDPGEEVETGFVFIEYKNGKAFAEY